MKELKITNKLSEIPSEFIRQSLGDALDIQGDRRYKLSMGDWHEYNTISKRCSVCLAGSVLARRTDVRVGEDLEDVDDVGDDNLRAKMIFIDACRHLDPDLEVIEDAFPKLHTEAHNDVRDLFTLIRGRHTSMSISSFGGALLVVADELEAMGI